MKITKRQLRRIIKEGINGLSEIRDERSPSGRQSAGGSKEAYEAGKAAGMKGDRSEMPLDQYGTPYYHAWMEGWDDGLAYFHR